MCQSKAAQHQAVKDDCLINENKLIRRGGIGGGRHCPRTRQHIPENMKLHLVI